jgi:lipoate-protein ligase A
MNKLKVFLSDSLNPHLNLATEEWIFHNLDPSQQVLFLWRNEETVVIGRNQNPWSECNLAKMKTDKVHLARRTTGGGAVFHDLGNTNFTFLSPREAYKRENNVQVIFQALKQFGIEGEASGRNDLLIPFADGPRKFSGSAYREKKDRAFHHGTLLLHADLTRLGQYLTPNPKKLQAKGKESVRARVANLTEVVDSLEHGKIMDSMIWSFEKFYDAKAEIVSLDLESLPKIPELKAQYDSLSSWEWLYGNTLEFNQKMDDYLSLGFFDFHFKVEDARISDVQIFTDCLYPQLIEELTTGLKGSAYTEEAVRGVFASLKPKYADLSVGLDELEQWLCGQVEA